ncbi:MAG TPA: acetate/propionate family kinase [Candidatus Binatia bacterium]|nr:acetate/propionate family kinase [Candidatus Binatia bacterium]
MPGGLRILCLNAGSSSFKVALYALDAVETRLLVGAVEETDGGAGRLWLRAGDGRPVADERLDVAAPAAAVHALLDALAAHGVGVPAAVGHRIVHGGPDHAAPVRVDAELLAALRRLVPFAPLHLPVALAGVEAVAARLPGVPQVACFDTAFHRGMPAVAQRLPLPRALWDAGIRRYGFHGLSYEYVVQEVGAAALGRAVIAHLGNGASLAAVREGRSVDTTMGFTPAGGCMMGTRPGDLDPGILVHLLAQRGYDAAALERLVEHESGLRGVSGVTPDMRTLLARRDGEPPAREAVELFCYSVRKHVGALATVLGGLDTLVFTGGIGERAAPVREEICRGLEHLGVRLDARRNAAHAPVVSAAESRCTVRVVPTDEDLMIARHTRAALAG